MPPITALMHTMNDALRLGRALETLRPCDELLIIDHGSGDATARIAREYGARVVLIETIAPPTLYTQLAHNHWVLCLAANESLTESLEASLYEWSSLQLEDATPYSVHIRQETALGWTHLPLPETRLIPRHWSRWRRGWPEVEAPAIALTGALLRFDFP